MKIATLVNYKFETCDVVIDRTSKWGNKFRIGIDGTREEVIEKYRQWLPTQPQLLKQLPELSGQRLGCCCSPKPCHGDVLIELVNKDIPNLTEEDWDDIFDD